MDRRLELHDILESIEGVEEVYFQEPSSDMMLYPCILYKLDAVHTEYAENLPYRHTDRWMITIMDRDPDSKIKDQVAALPTAAFSRRFVADGLNHTIYNLHF